jgi:hypothetical protein
MSMFSGYMGGVNSFNHFTPHDQPMTPLGCQFQTMLNINQQADPIDALPNLSEFVAYLGTIQNYHEIEAECYQYLERLKETDSKEMVEYAQNLFWREFPWLKIGKCNAILGNNSAFSAFIVKEDEKTKLFQYNATIEQRPIKPSAFKDTITGKAFIVPPSTPKLKPISMPEIVKETNSSQTPLTIRRSSRIPKKKIIPIFYKEFSASNFSVEPSSSSFSFCELSQTSSISENYEESSESFNPTPRRRRVRKQAESQEENKDLKWAVRRVIQVDDDSSVYSVEISKLKNEHQVLEKASQLSKPIAVREGRNGFPESAGTVQVEGTAIHSEEKLKVIEKFLEARRKTAVKEYEAGKLKRVFLIMNPNEFDKVLIRIVKVQHSKEIKEGVRKGQSMTYTITMKFEVDPKTREILPSKEFEYPQEKYIKSITDKK